MNIRRITNPMDSAIGAFVTMQNTVYFDPDALIPGGAIRMMLSMPMTGRKNFLIVAEDDDSIDGNPRLLGGVIFHYLKKPNVGFSSFMGTTLEARGKGVGRKLHEARFALLDEVAGKNVEGVFLDSVAPERLTQEDIEAEHRVGADPIVRRDVFQHLGFRKVAIRYEQPVGGPNGGPVTNMDLLFCPHDPNVKSIPTVLVVATMQGYWSPWLGPVAAKHHANILQGWANGKKMSELENLV
ncbi:MAG: GNAT family N-acetyltransferase [Trueperaceae bacterium]